MKTTRQLFQNALAMTRTDRPVANRGPMSDEQRKAIFARMGRGGASPASGRPGRPTRPHGPDGGQMWAGGTPPWIFDPATGGPNPDYPHPDNPNYRKPDGDLPVSTLPVQRPVPVPGPPDRVSIQPVPPYAPLPKPLERVRGLPMPNAQTGVNLKALRRLKGARHA